MKKSLLSLGLLGSALADNVLDTNGDSVYVGQANIGTAQKIKHSTTGAFDITIKPGDFYDNTGTADKWNVQLNAQFDFISGKIPGTLHKVEIYRRTTCADATGDPDLTSTFTVNTLTHVDILDWSPSADEAVGGALHDQYHPVGAKHSCETVDGVQTCQPCRVGAKNSDGTDAECIPGGQSPTTYPICVKLVNVDETDGTKNYGEFQAKMTLKYKGGGFYGQTDLDFKESSSTGVIVTVNPKDTILSQSWSLDATTAQIEKSGSGTGINAEQTTDTTKNKWVTDDGKTHSTVSSSFSNTFKVKNAHLQDETFISGDFPDQVATMSATSQYSGWASTAAAHTSLTDNISEVTDDRSVDNSNDLTITYTGNITFTVPYPHLKKSYILTSTCSAEDETCTGKLTIAGASSSYETAVVGSNGWAQDHYECQQIVVDASLKKSLDTNPFDITDNVMLSDLFDKTKFPTDVDCDLDDTLTFYPPSGVTDCASSPEELGAKTKGTQSSWLEAAFDACVVIEPSAPTDATLSSSTVKLQTTGTTAADAVTSDTFYFGPARNNWAIVTAPETGSSKLHLDYTASNYTKEQVEFSCPTTGAGVFATVLQIDGADVSGPNAPLVTGLDSPACYGADTVGLTLTAAAHIDHDPNKATSTKGFTSGTCKDITLTATQTITTSQLSEWSAVSQSGASGSDQLSASVTLYAEIPSAARHHKATFNDDSAVGTTDSAVSNGTISLEITDQLPPITAGVQYPTKNTAGEYLATLPDANEITFDAPAGMDTEVAKAEVKCGTNKLPGSWTAAPDFPCSDATLARQYNVYKRHKDTDVDMTVGLAGGALSVDETDVYASSSGVGNAANQHKFPAAVKLCSTAITRDKQHSKLTNLVVTAAAYRGSTYVLDNPQADGDCFKYDLTASGVRTDLVTGDETDTLSFTGKYTYHKGADACIQGTETAETVTITGTVDVKYVKQADKFGGRIEITDNQNRVTSLNLPQTNHVEDVVMEYAVALTELDTAERSPTITVDIQSENGGDGEIMKIIYDKTKLSRSIGDTDCTDNNCKVCTGTSCASTSASSGLSVQLQVQVPYAATEGDNKVANDVFRTFTIYVEGAGGATSRRKVELKVKIAPDPSRPFYKVSTADGAFDSNNKLTLDDDDIADIYDATDFTKVTFPLANILIGSGTHADEVIEFNPSTVDSCLNSGIASGSSGGTLTSTTQYFVFHTNDECETTGQVAFSYQAQCFEIVFPCKRHATVTVTNLDVSLNYGSTFSLQNGLVLSNPQTSTLHLGAICTVAGGAVSEKNQDNMCTIPVDHTQMFGGTLATMLPYFQKCHNIQGGYVRTDDGGKWKMNVVRAYSQGTSKFCQSSELQLDVKTDGEAHAVVAVQSISEVEYDFYTSQFYFSDETTEGCTGTERRLILVIAGQATVDGEDVGYSTLGHDVDSAITDMPSSFAKTAAGSPPSETLSVQSTCQDFCSSAVRTIDFSFTAESSSNNQLHYGVVSGQATMSGNPCSDTAVAHNSFSATLEVAVPNDNSVPCDANAGNFAASCGEAYTDDSLCYHLIEDASVSYALTKTNHKFEERAIGSSDPYIKISPQPTLSDEGNNFYKLDDISDFGNKDIKLTVDWTYVITEDGTRRMLRSTYLLGSGQDGESTSSLRILPAEVQVQEQIEAAGASQEASQDASPSLDVTAPAPTGVEDHSHDNTGLLIGVLCTGAGVLVLAGFMVFQAVQKRADDRVGVTGYQYQKVGRFQSNLAF
jgi:hypothetical protein